MVSKSIQRDQLWKALYTFAAARPGHVIRLYYKCRDNQYESLPLVFQQDNYRLPRLRVEPEALRKAKALPQSVMVTATSTGKTPLITLSAACSKYFGPLCRPERANQTYNAYNELHVHVEEIVPVFPDVHTRFFYGQFIRFDQLAALYFDEPVTHLPVVAETEPTYQPQLLFPLNQILYGPPGTGKTYHSVTYAVAIIEGKSVADVRLESRADVRKRYENYREAGQIEFITFHQSYAYEEFVQGLRPDAERNTETLHFRLADGVFKRIADRAKASHEAYQQNRSQPQVSFEGLLDGLLTEQMNRETEEVEVPLMGHQGQFKSIIIYEVGDTHLKYRRRSLREVVKDEERLLSMHKLKEKYYGKEIREAINKPYYESVVQAVKQYEKRLKSPENGDQLRRYVLIIDEINRANISRVFGELITLLEADKRYGSENSVTVTLPSGEPFAVPPNLYLVGTMNTADKSIAQLDVALRRRFAFTSMFPDYEIIPEFAPLLRALNEKIREKKGTDFLIGHSFFIGKTSEELPAIFNRQIIPLLYEYFNNRPEQVREVLQATGLEITEEHYQWVVK